MFCPQCGAENIAESKFCRQCGTALLVVPPTPNENYAGFWLRVLALIIDKLILGIPGIIIGISVMARLFSMPLEDLENVNSIEDLRPYFGLFGMIVATACIQAIGNWLYFALMESSSKQATLGKMAIGIKVTTLDGGRINFGRASVRYFGKILSGLILGIGYIMAGLSTKKQALHDMLADTLVVRKS